MNYKEINAENGTIAIGYIGDNLASKVIFDTSEIIGIYGTDGVFDLLVRQQTNRHCPPKVYPATIETDGNNVIWYPTAQDTSSGQYMDVELVYTIGEQVVYNRMFRCVCKKSLANEPRGNAPESGWVATVLAAAADIRTSAETAGEQATQAAQSATSANESAESASASAESAAGSASASAESATSAAQSAQTAQTAADSVTVATVAETESYLGI